MSLITFGANDNPPEEPEEHLLSLLESIGGHVAHGTLFINFNILNINNTRLKDEYIGTQGFIALNFRHSSNPSADKHVAFRYIDCVDRTNITSPQHVEQYLTMDFMFKDGSYVRIYSNGILKEAELFVQDNEPHHSIIINLKTVDVCIK